MESDSTLNHPWIHLSLSIAYLFVFLSTTIGNFLILYVFVSQKRVRSVPNFFLANLTVADLFVGIFCVLQNAVHFVFQGHGRWPFGKVLCYTYIYTLHLVPNVSAGILVLVSIERLIAVVRPLRVRRAFSYRVLVSCSAFVWISSAIMNLPYFFASQYREFSDENETLSICTRRHIEIGGVNVLKLVATINFIIWYAIPLCVLLFIYATIGIVVTRAANMSKQPIDKLLPRSSWRSEKSSVAVDKSKRVGRLAVGIVVAFAVFSLPRYAYFMWTVWRDPTVPRCLDCLQSLMQPISFLLLFFNSAVDPFLYAFLSTRFRQSIKETFGLIKVRENTVELSSRHQKRPTTQNLSLLEKPS